MNKDFQFIKSDSALSDLCKQLQGCNWLVLDTEFERVNTYYPELCLLQLANRELTAVVDPLQITNLEPLYDILYDSSLLKVFHSARQDLELFFHLKAAIPEPLFDTQLAATMLGYDDQIGYANLVNELLGVELAKSQTRTNWKRRPLSRSQLEYAADDVIYLVEVYEILSARVKQAGNGDTLEEQCRGLQNPALYEPDPATMWKKIRAAKYLKGRSLAVLKLLAAWRETTARKENEPRKWILPDHTLVEMARALPESLEELSTVKDMSKRVVRGYGERILNIIGTSSHS